MNNDAEDIAMDRFNVDLDSLTESEKKVVQCFVNRIHVSRDTNQGFETKLSFGERPANKVAAVGGS